MEQRNNPGSLARNRDLLWVLAGGTINDIGDWMLVVALPVYVYLETASGIATAAVFLIELVIGVALGPYGGSLADRWNIRRTLIATNALQAITLLPLLLVTESRLWLVYVVTAAQAMIMQVNNPASFALVPRIVDEERLGSANALLATGGSVARLVGAPLGGIIVATGGLAGVVIADAVTFVFAGFCASMISRAALQRTSPRTDETAVEAADDTAFKTADDTAGADSSVRAGLQVVRAVPPVKSVLWVNAFASLAFGAFNVVFIAFVADYLNGGGTEVGVIRGSAAFGGIVSGLIVTRFVDRWDSAVVMVGGFAVFFVVGLLFVNAPPFTTTLWVYAVLFMLTGFPNVASSVGVRTTLQRLIPREALGRLGGLNGAVTALASGIGSIGVGALLSVTTARVLFNFQTACFAICAAIGYFGVLRPLRTGRPDPAQTASPR